MLYAAGEHQGGGKVYAWNIKGATLTPAGIAGSVFSEQAGEQVAGGGLCHLTVDSKGRLLFATGYSDSTVQTFSLNSNGSIGKHLHTIIHQGSGPVTNRQEKAHPHSVWLSPDENILSVCDLGMDKLISYTIDDQSGELRRCSSWDLDFPPGCGPRHLVYAPDKRHAYVLTELSREVYGLSFHPQEGFKIIESRRLPESDRPNSEPVLAAAIRCSSDGRFLYASIRGDDSITAIHLDSQGRMNNLSRFDSHGSSPRDFILGGKDDRVLFCANRSSDAIAWFNRDPETGALEYAGVLGGVDDPVSLIAEGTDH
jgi:6-phosphogluconolactonase